jgi:hypothetical protein
MRQEANTQRKAFVPRRGKNLRGKRGGRGPQNVDDRQQGNATGGNDRQDAGRPFKKRFIRKNRDEAPKVEKGGKVENKRGGKREKGGKKEDRDLDRELRDYWVTHKGADKGDASILSVT